MDLIYYHHYQSNHCARLLADVICGEEEGRAFDTHGNWKTPSFGALCSWTIAGFGSRDVVANWYCVLGSEIREAWMTRRDGEKRVGPIASCARQMLDYMYELIRCFVNIQFLWDLEWSTAYFMYLWRGWYQFMHSSSIIQVSPECILHTGLDELGEHWIQQHMQCAFFIVFLFLNYNPTCFWATLKGIPCHRYSTLTTHRNMSYTGPEMSIEQVVQSPTTLSTISTPSALSYFPRYLISTLRYTRYFYLISI